MKPAPSILVIKLSALGDFVQAFGPFAAIRAHHPDAHITLLTTKPYAAFAAASPWFDTVWTDQRPKIWDAKGLFKLRALMRSVRFDMVYDLQTSDRSGWYFHLMGKPPWSGIASGCSYPHANPERDFMHTLDRQAEQLAMAGIPSVPPPDLSWVKADLSGFALSEPYALLAPGGAAHRPRKRWPAERFAELASELSARGILPVLIGAEADREAVEAVIAGARGARALLGHTSLEQIVMLARGAALAIGNDTGPMHLAAAAGCKTIVLFSAESDPDLCAPRGRVILVRRDDLAMLELAPVRDAVDSILAFRSS